MISSPDHISLTLPPVSGEWERIAPDHTKHHHTLGDRIIGVVITVGRDITKGRFRAGDAVIGYVDGMVVATFNDQELVNVKQMNLWRISTATANKSMTVASGTGDTLL
ncbi:hypothetical protein FRB93_009663 [Tulasnella sp. JGI-2019a]|nr:hypothetical protein FRB93_009663 [Tulasnella sp. JGI-2019a]